MQFLLASISISFGGGFKQDSKSVKALNALLSSPWCGVRPVQPEPCKKCSGKQKKVSLQPQCHSFGSCRHTEGEKAQRRSSAPKSLKGFAKISSPKSRCFSLELGLRLSHLKLHFEANNVATEELKTKFFYPLILFCFH